MALIKSSQTYALYIGLVSQIKGSWLPFLRPAFLSLTNMKLLLALIITVSATPSPLRTSHQLVEAPLHKHFYIGSPFYLLPRSPRASSIPTDATCDCQYYSGGCRVRRSFIKKNICTETSQELRILSPTLIIYIFMTQFDCKRMTLSIESIKQTQTRNF